MLELLEYTSLKHQQDASLALYKLAQKATSVCAMDAAPPSPTPQVSFLISSNLYAAGALLCSS